MDPGVLAAYNAINGWFEQAIGATGQARITVELAGGGAQFSGSSSVSVSVNFPGVSQGLAGIGLELSITDQRRSQEPPAPGAPSSFRSSTLTVELSR
jgi:hypothetical protein